MNAKEKWSKTVPWLGLALVIAYWLWLKPPTPGILGYAEDLGGIEVSRQIMADNLREFGWPRFHSDRMMAPFGTSAAFASWAIERDWLGAIVMNWSKSFPFLWAYFGASLVATYLGVGAILRRMGRSRPAAWGLAALVTLVDIPRHFTAYYHYEHLVQHWVYFGLFVDAWIWQKFVRERRISLHLELWRGVCALGVMGISGYFWGPMLFEWFLTRICLLAGWVRSRKSGETVELELFLRKSWLPAALAALLVAIDLAWFIPLAREVGKLGEVGQGLGWFGTIGMVVRPLWLEWLIPVFGEGYQRLLQAWQLTPVYWLETTVTIGWLYWIPVILAIALVRRGRGGPGTRVLKPFLWFLAFVLLYLRHNSPRFIHTVIRAVVPFMTFFRVPSRMGLFLVPLSGTILALAWPELSAWVRARWPSPKFKALLAAFVAMSALEATTLGYPPVTVPALNPSMLTLLEDVKNKPGTTVLDLPFCVASGNGVCGLSQCPNYGASVTPQYMTFWHDKKVYGFYEGRFVDQQCQTYNRRPYTAWFNAWGQQRCFTPFEWDEFCGYLDAHPEIGTVLAYSIWTAVEEPSCARAFQEHLGPVLNSGDLFAGFERGKPGIKPTRVYEFAGKCRRSAPEVRK